MKKKVALIGAALGVAGGLIYALESQRRQNQSAKADKGADKEATVPGRSSETSSANRKSDESQTGPAASMGKVENERTANAEESQHVIDDHGTDQFEASQILRSIRDKAFESSDERLALALGRPTEEISEWTSGSGLVDGDVLMKARTLAMQRGFEV